MFSLKDLTQCKIFNPGWACHILHIWLTVTHIIEFNFIYQQQLKALIRIRYQHFTVLKHTSLLHCFWSYICHFYTFSLSKFFVLNSPGVCILFSHLLMTPLLPFICTSTPHLVTLCLVSNSTTQVSTDLFRLFSHTHFRTILYNVEGLDEYINAILKNYISLPQVSNWFISQG